MQTLIESAAVVFNVTVDQLLHTRSNKTAEIARDALTLILLDYKKSSYEDVMQTLGFTRNRSVRRSYSRATQYMRTDSDFQEKVKTLRKEI